MADALGTPGGVVSAKDHRLANGGLLATQGSSTLDARTGVMWGPGTTALVTGTSATAPMTVSIAPHHAVSSRGAGDGPYLGPTLESSTTVTIAAAPGSNSRIDVVYAKQGDTASSISPDGASAPVYGVVQGTASATPAKPSLSGVVGAVEIATVQVAAGATATNGAGVTISNTAAQVVARGALIPVRNQAEQDALTTFPGLRIHRLDTGRGYVYHSSWTQMYGPLLTPVALPVNSNMGSFGSGFSTPRYVKDLDGFVHLMGFAKLLADVPAATSKTVVNVGGMPAGYRPTAGAESVMGLYNGYQAIRFDIAADGSVILVNNTVITLVASGSYIQLGNAKYPTFG